LENYFQFLSQGTVIEFVVVVVVVVVIVVVVVVVSYTPHVRQLRNVAMPW
jgi:hypothetical protein